MYTPVFISIHLTRCSTPDNRIITKIVELRFDHRDVNYVGFKQGGTLRTYCISRLRKWILLHKDRILGQSHNALT